MKSLLFLAFLVSCGTESSNNSGDSNQIAPPDSTERVEPSQLPKATMLRSLDDLPACEIENQNQLVYVIAEASFFTCANDWELIDLKGDDGKDGKDGSPGLDASEFWEDPVTGSLWYKAGQAYGSTGARCLTEVNQGVFGYPTVSEAQEALKNGLYKGYRFRIALDYNSPKYLYSDNPDQVFVSANGFQGFLICKYTEN